MAYLNNKEILFSTNVNMVKDCNLISSTIKGDTQELDITDAIYDEKVLPKIISREITEVSATDLNGCTKIGTSAFSTCFELTEVVLPDTIKIISATGFYNCENLTSITMPAVEEIGASAFHNCIRLSNVTLPATIKSLETYCFYNTAITTMTINATTPPSVGLNALPDTLSSISVPYGCGSTYMADENFKKYMIMEMSRPSVG